MSGLALLGASLVLLALAAWAGAALWFQAPGRPWARQGLVALWLLFSVVMVAGLWAAHARASLLAFGLAFAALQVWWHTLRPSNERAWADDVAHVSHGEVDGDALTLHNVRNFRWRSRTDYTQRWETRRYDLSRLHSLDMITSYWRSRAIAHLLFSFGFTDGEHVVFSVEIRRKQGEAFNEIGGFFKEFELSIIAADERDVIAVRTNVRGEDDYLYRLRLPPADIRALFMAYLEQANRLVRTPRFYNTVTVNCTTLVYRMLRQIVGALPMSYRVVFSGFLPEYVYSLGGLDGRYTPAELRELGRITERAKQDGGSERFSAAIRTGIPELAD
jgi:Domain of unknown function (DUF4105)